MERGCTKKKGRKFFCLFLQILILATLLISAADSQQKTTQEEQITQNPPDQAPPQEIQKPRLDYMSTFLSRTTGPLGLKEDQEFRHLLKQSKVKWAIRAGVRHILN